MWLVSKIRKLKLSRYKKKKVKKERTLKNRTYFVKFTIKVDDPINPQESDVQYEMMLPAKAAFYAKDKATRSIQKKIVLDFIDCVEVTGEQLQEFDDSKLDYERELREKRED